MPIQTNGKIRDSRRSLRCTSGVAATSCRVRSDVANSKLICAGKESKSLGLTLWSTYILSGADDGCIQINTHFHRHIMCE